MCVTQQLMWFLDLKNLTLQNSQSYVLLTSSSIRTVLMYNGQRAFLNHEICLELVHPALFKIRTKTRPSVDKIGSRAYTQRTGNPHFGPIEKLFQKSEQSTSLQPSTTHWYTLNFFYVEQHPLWGQGLLIFDASRSHSDTPCSVGFLWTSHQPVAETFTWHTTHSTHKTDIQVLGRIQIRKFSKRAAADTRLRPDGQWDRHTLNTWYKIEYNIFITTSIHSAYFSPCLAWVCYLLKWCGFLRDLE
jgi:hypothetical protein